MNLKKCLKHNVYKEIFHISFYKYESEFITLLLLLSRFFVNDFHFFMFCLMRFDQIKLGIHHKLDKITVNRTFKQLKLPFTSYIFS